MRALDHHMVPARDILAHPYLFVWNSPCSFVDPDGRWAIDAILFIIANRECIAALGEMAGYAYSVWQDEAPNDKWGHCMAHCEVADACGDLASDVIGELKEYIDDLTGGEFDWGDIEANHKGRDCEGECKCCCQEYL